MEPGESLIAYLDGLADELREKGAKALAEFDRDDVHESRVASRRLSSATELLGPLAARKARRAVERSLGKSRRRLGRHRDLDVMLARLSELGADERLAAGANLLVETLEARREALREKTRGGLPELKQWGAWRDEIAAHLEGVPTVLSGAVHDKLDEVVRLAGSLASPHPLRIAAKELRYALELAAEVGMWRDELLLGKLKALQDTLGAWHDFAVVADEALRLARKGERPFRAERDGLHLAELAGECLHKAQWKLGEFRAAWEREGDEVERAVRAAFPLVRDASQADEERGAVDDAERAIVVPAADTAEAADESPVED